MNKDKYAETFLNAYHSGVFEIIWNTSGFSLGVDSRKKELIPELKEKKFIDYSFSIIKIVMDLAENKEVENVLKDDLEVARIVYSQEKDLKNHLYVKKNSKINCFKLLEGQIISYRNDDNPKIIDANSAIIKMLMEKNDEDLSYTFEVSRRDLENIINDLTELKDKMDSI